MGVAALANAGRHCRTAPPLVDEARAHARVLADIDACACHRVRRGGAFRENFAPFAVRRRSSTASDAMQPQPPGAKPADVFLQELRHCGHAGMNRQTAAERLGWDADKVKRVGDALYYKELVRTCVTRSWVEEHAVLRCVPCLTPCVALADIHVVSAPAWCALLKTISTTGAPTFLHPSRTGAFAIGSRQGSELSTPARTHLVQVQRQPQG